MKNLLLGVLIIAVLGGGYVLYTQQQKLSELSGKLTSSEPAPSVTPTPGANVNQPISASIAPTTAPSSSPNQKKPVVVFQAEGSIPAQDKSQLQARIVNPLIEYYEETEDDSEVVSITIEPNKQESKDEYPYLATAIFANGGNNGFVISKNDAGIAWWAPECMICVFSDAYKAKYPEVVSQVQ
jgi:hypothetical protein